MYGSCEPFCAVEMLPDAVEMLLDAVEMLSVLSTEDASEEAEARSREDVEDAAEEDAEEEEAGGSTPGVVSPRAGAITCMMGK